MAEEIVVIVEPPPAEISVVIELPPPDINVIVSEVSLAGPPGDPMTLLDTVMERLEPDVDYVLLFENAIT